MPDPSFEGDSKDSDRHLGGEARGRIAEAAGAPVDALADGDGDDLVVELAAPVTVKRGQALRLTLPLTGSA